MAERLCPKCGREQPGTSESKQCVYCGAALEQAEAEAPAADGWVTEEPAAPVPETSAPQTVSEEPVPEGKRKCPSCGEILYATEQRCWRCGHEIVPPDVPVVAVPPAAAPGPPPAQPPLVVPTVPPTVPTAAYPPPVAPPVAPPVIPTAPPYTPAGTPAVVPDAAAQNLGIWALVLGLLGLVCCPIVPSIAAIVLGVRARKRGVTALGMAGMVMGIIGLVVYVPLITLFLIGIIAGESGSATNDATSWLWSVRWILS